nr:hypothetical protein [Brevundimonas naejangsanensis]
MRSTLEARYLDIEWLEPGQARLLRASPEPIEIEIGPDGRMSVELQIFHDLHPWLGLQLHGDLAHETPAFVTAAGERRPMLSVVDEAGEIWWVQNDGWDPVKKRHLSELHRTMGRFEIAIGPQSLLIENIASGLSRSHLEEYLSDFQQELMWLVLGFGSGSTKTGSGAGHAELVKALTDFTTAARRVISHPAREIRETSAETIISRLRPNTATFRQHARRPDAQRLVGRCSEETLDISDNRYMRHMVQVCAALASKTASAAERQHANLSAWAQMEGQRSLAYRNMESRPVDPEIFDLQLSELKTKIEKIETATFRPEACHKEENFPIEIGKNYASNDDEFFFKKLNGTNESDINYNIKYNVVELPANIAYILNRSRSFCKKYTISGSATITRKSNKVGKNYRHVSFDSITAIACHTQALAEKQSKREQLERDNWITLLSRQDREEMNQEARTAELREGVYLRQAAQTAATATALAALGAELKQKDQAWRVAGVQATPLLPTGMRYHMSPDYAGCLAAFTQVNAIAGRSGLSLAAMEALDNRGVLHASAIYERWCLIKIISVLIQDYGFIPEGHWQDRLIRSVTGRPESLTLGFHRQDLAMAATLEFQPLLPNGRRPDFRLRFSDGRPSFEGDKPGLVFDAKFRTKWRTGELARMLDELVASKRYDQEGDRVFILQPAAATIAQPSSPLRWGRDCDFGQTYPRDHKQGWIHLAPGRGASSPTLHLRRLIALELQHAFAFPDTPEDDQKIWKSNSICIRCGTHHSALDITPKETRAGKPYWSLRCSSCETATTRTHCFSCARPLFKNGVDFTYHLTLADQITNARCPQCDEYFDADWRNLNEHRPQDPAH